MWPDTSTTHGSVEFERGDVTLTIGEGGPIKADLYPLRARGPYQYSGVPLAGEPGESPSPPTPTPLVALLECHVVGTILFATGAAPDPEELTPVEALNANLDWLLRFCDTPDNTTGTYPSTLAVPGVGDHTAHVHLELVIPDRGLYSTFGKVPLKVTVPTGRYTPVPDPPEDP